MTAKKNIFYWSLVIWLRIISLDLIFCSVASLEEKAGAGMSWRSWWPVPITQSIERTIMNRGRNAARQWMQLNKWQYHYFYFFVGLLEMMYGLPSHTLLLAVWAIRGDRRWEWPLISSVPPQGQFTEAGDILGVFTEKHAWNMKFFRHKNLLSHWNNCFIEIVEWGTTVE